MGDKLPALVVYTDGSCLHNPGGKGAYAAVIFKDGVEIARKIEAFVKTTSNRMELMGVLKVLEALRSRHAVVFISDSKYVVNGINSWMRGWNKQGWPARIGNKDLWKQIFTLGSHHELKAHWVRAHFGQPRNELADALCTHAARNGPWQKDEGYGTHKGEPAQALSLRTLPKPKSKRKPPPSPAKQELLDHLIREQRRDRREDYARSGGINSASSWKLKFKRK